MAVLHVNAEELAVSLAEMLQGLVPVEQVILGPAGSALASHLGPGAAGVCALMAPAGNRAA